MGRFSKVDAVRNPDISQVHAGMCVRAKFGAEENWGTCVDAVDRLSRRVLVRHYVGGARECRYWIPIADVREVWRIAGVKDAGTLIEDLTRVVGRFRASATYV
jgi:hypothetical protein